MQGKSWQGNSGASKAAVEKLASIAPINLPKSYLEFLCKHNGGQGPIKVQPCWLVLYPAEEVLEIEASGVYQEFFKDYFVIGGNGGGEAIAFTEDQQGRICVVYFDTTNIDLAESVEFLASSFEVFLEQIES